MPRSASVLQESESLPFRSENLLPCLSDIVRERGDGGNRSRQHKKTDIFINGVTEC